jgi:hypothetical protein
MANLHDGKHCLGFIEEMGEVEKNQFFDWLRQFVEVPSSFTAGLPVCPFAKEARTKQSIAFHRITEPSGFIEELEILISEFLANPEKIFVAASSAIEILKPNLVRSAVHELREKYFSSNVWLLYDHPQCREPMDSQHQFNHGKLVLFFVQPLSKLVEAANALKTTDYYSKWSPEYYREVVEVREEYYRRYIAAAANSKNLRQLLT